MRHLLLAVTLLSLGAGVAIAKPKPTDKDLAAKQAYEEATKAYNLGKFDKAIEAYERAYDLKPDPVFLFNIAQSHRLNNNFKQALFFYKSFLRNAPDAPNRAQIEERIAELEEWVAKQQVTANAPPVGTAEPESDGRSRIPSPDETAEAGDDDGEETAAATPAAPAPSDGGGSRPIYKKWWFWAGIGAVAIGTTAIVIATTGDDGSSAPDAHFPVRSAF
ncbi:MAG: hypothetical protein IT370_03315 [Deltaproteobacteria bacterium]|nr:hypothetical protein [Deltaproteobacteria bacterium]